MTAKLDTTDGVLDWVYEQTRETYAGRSYDTATAAYLAECVRLRQAWDSPAVADMRRCANDEDDILCILEFALQGKPLPPYLQSKVDGAKANGEARAEYRAALEEVKDE